MKIKFNISQRLLSIGILNQFKGDLNKLAEVLFDLKVLNLKPEEIKDYGIKNDGKSITWDPKKDLEKEFELSDTSVKGIKDFIKENSLLQMLLL